MDGTLTTYQQQVQYWSKKGKDQCPKEQFLSDLAVEIQQWQDEGDHITLQIDMNKDNLAPRIKEFCTETNPIEAIAMIHGLEATPTHQQGSMAIDGIFISLHLASSIQGGFGDITISDHEAVWLDIPAQLLGFSKT